ncbi:hypothetical protein CXB51_022417 [Gossypium anomalum]|uniref:Reverse transcriptase domain-containing protein n=1 Tax=Gossypium anomalum TaxID=47600 RepID=A0A8J5YRX6_9ROSI|nr:hypothetical protein CXB51_022417 [Gossypium anomalum]
MLQMGFESEWVALIMKCITTASYAVSINGRRGRIFQLTRGLRQADPFSPFLFLICSEGLSSLMRLAMEEGLLKGAKARRRVPEISQLLFTDDCILFGSNISVINDAWIPDASNSRLSSVGEAERILRIPLAREPHDDFMVWSGEPLGEFSVRGAYKLLQISDPRAYALQTIYRDFYKKLWLLNLPTKIKITIWKISWNYVSTRDLAQAFMKQYGHVTDIAPDKITLQNMEKKQSESFRQYAQRWREVATQVQPPLLEKETTSLFINTLKAPFIAHMLGSATLSFSDIVMSSEMIENAIRSEKIDA